MFHFEIVITTGWRYVWRVNVPEHAGSIKQAAMPTGVDSKSNESTIAGALIPPPRGFPLILPAYRECVRASLIKSCATDDNSFRLILDLIETIERVRFVLGKFVDRGSAGIFYFVFPTKLSIAARRYFCTCLQFNLRKKRTFPESALTHVSTFSPENIFTS